MKLSAKFSIEKLYNILLVLLAFSISLFERITPIVIILLAIVSLISRVKHKIFFKKGDLAYLFFAIFFYYVIRLYGSHNFAEGLKFIEKNLSYLIIPIVVIPSLITNINNVYKGFILSFALVCVNTIVLSTINFLFFNPENVWYFQTIEKFGFHPTYMGLYALISIIILDKLKPFNTRINLLLIGVNILFIIFSASRIAIFGLIFIFIFRAIIFRKKSYVYTLFLAGALLIAAYFVSNDFRYKIDQLKSFKGFDYYDNNDYGSVSVRVAKIMAASNVWSDNYWFGYGTGGLNEALNEQYRSKAIECWPCSQRKYNPHNQYLSVLAGHGVIGFALFVVLFGYLLFYAIKYKNIMLIEFIIIFLIVGLTESILERQKGLLLFTFITFYQFSTIKFLNEKK